MSSDEYTTTAAVREIAGLTVADYTDALRACFDAKGWCSCCTARPLDDTVRSLSRLPPRGRMARLSSAAWTG